MDGPLSLIVQREFLKHIVMKNIRNKLIMITQINCSDNLIISIQASIWTPIYNIANCLHQGYRQGYHYGKKVY